MVPGEAFGTPGYFRLSYALGDAELEEGVTRMAKCSLTPVGGPGLRRRPAPTEPDGTVAVRAAEGAPAPAPDRGDAARDDGRAWRGRHGIRLPPALTRTGRRSCSGTDERGWFRFQRLYDIARSVLRTPADIRRLVAETAQDEQAEGSRWLEIQVDPSGYAARFGGITAMTRAAARRGRGPRRRRPGSGSASSSRPTGPGIRWRPGRWPGWPPSTRAAGVAGFGLSNDERRGPAREFAPAFRIAERAGLLLVPHGGELCGPASVTACLD